MIALRSLAEDISSVTLEWGAKDWLPIAASAAVVLLLLLIASYWRVGASRSTRLLAGSLKALAILILALCLLEPLFAGKRARPGANQFVILADNSESMTLKNPDDGKTRGDQLKALTKKDADWITQLGRDFDLRQYAFDNQLRSVDDFEGLTFNGHATDLGAALNRLVTRYKGRPLAGIFLFTDGSATDLAAIDRLLAQKSAEGSTVPPIYPVLMGRDTPTADTAVSHVDVTQTNFEDSPVTISAQLTTHAMRGKTIVAELLDDTGKSLQQQKFTVDLDGQPLVARFLVKPEKSGISFYKVRVAADGQLAQFDHPETSTEATLANNTRLVAVDRGRGPFKVLYLAGRPNWEFKFLQRSIQEDSQVQLAGLIRIAKREPKFQFLGGGNGARQFDNNNPLFRGFNDDPNGDQPREFDKPIMERINTNDDKELADGFPKTAEELFAYHALIIDDLESEFFTQDQMLLIKEFVRQRGGGLLMLGGTETFKNGNYDRTPIGDLLPVYSDQVPDLQIDGRVRLDLSREGWLEPWLRLHTEEAADQVRLQSMPGFLTLNPVRGIKPGATTLASAILPDGTKVPALVEQRFGKGRGAAMLIGDLWQWEMRRPDPTNNDFEKAWRQTIRWLVSDVPDRVEVSVTSDPKADEMPGTLHLSVHVRDPAFIPLDNAAVTVKITTPEGKVVTSRADASAKEPGLYETPYVPQTPGAYRAEVTAVAIDGHDAGTGQAGWTSDPAAEEFAELQPNTALLDRIARATGGEVVKASNIASFAAGLPTRKAEITEPYNQPFWHQSWIFLLAIACLATEWGLRRWKGLP